MKADEIMLVGGALLALYVVTRPVIAGTSGGVAGAVQKLREAAPATQEIFETNGSTFDNGWRYYTDGTAIGPDGKYYKEGALVWSPA